MLWHGRWGIMWICYAGTVKTLSRGCKSVKAKTATMEVLRENIYIKILFRRIYLCVCTYIYIYVFVRAPTHFVGSELR